MALQSLQRTAMDIYAFVDPLGRHILCWDHGRFINHSCEPGVRTIGNFEIAVRDIAPGEELTCEYVTLNLNESFACACGSARCRKIICPDDISSYADEWDAETRVAARDVLSVPQPLSDIVNADEESRELLELIRTGRFQELPSCRTRVYVAPASNEGAASGLWASHERVAATSSS